MTDETPITKQPTKLSPELRKLLNARIQNRLKGFKQVMKLRKLAKDRGK